MGLGLTAFLKAEEGRLEDFRAAYAKATDRPRDSADSFHFYGGRISIGYAKTLLRNLDKPQDTTNTQGEAR